LSFILCFPGDNLDVSNAHRVYGNARTISISSS
jgi:hypothetical protein